MRCILLVCSILSIFAFNEQKICVNCKHFNKDFWSEKKFGKCTLFPREEISKSYLVDGKHDIKNDDYYYCSTARGFDSLCGEKGTFFEKK
jgi:hypothetical protein